MYMPRKHYTSNLTPIEYNIISQYLPEISTKPLQYSYHQILNGIFYVTKNGCTWRDIPADLPPWKTCYYHFRKLAKLGIWERIKLELNKQVRNLLEERSHYPSCLLLDTQSVKNTDTGCQSGIDGNKKIKGIKKVLLVDTLGLNWDRQVVSANTGDRDCGLSIAQTVKYKNILNRCEVVKLDEGFSGESFALEFFEETGVLVEVVEKPKNQRGFAVLPMRWVVERSNAWMDKCRRMWKNCERTVDSALAMIDICFLRIALKRLGRY
jgi:putative transposase